MKKIIFIIIGSLGWILLGAFLLASYLVNTYSSSSTMQNGFFASISWSENIAALEGAIACTLTDDEFLERKKQLQEKVFVHVTQKEELEDGFIFYFEDTNDLHKHLFDFITAEKQCCPFFQYDLSILPFGRGIALKISGSAGVKDFLEMNLVGI